MFDNWYWFIGADRTQVFSSARGILQPIYHPDYVAWTQANPTGAPTIASYSELFDLLTAQAPSVANRVGFSWVQAGLLTTSQSYTAYMNSGVTVTSSGAPGINGTYPIGTVAILGYNLAKVLLVTGSLSFPELFPDINGTLHVFPTSGAFNLFFSNVMNYYSSIQTLGAGASGAWPSPVLVF